jgi:flagellin-like hook-associated protein FlgL
VFRPGPPPLRVGGGPPVAVPATNQAFTTADGRTLSLNVTGVPATLTGTFTARAGLSTDGGATVTDVVDFTAVATPVRNGYDASVLQVDVRQLTRTGVEQVEHAGTFDTFTLLITLRDLLVNEAGLPDDAIRDRTARLLGEIDGAHDAVLDGLSELGFRSSGLDVLENRVASLKLSGTQTLSLIQDADLAESILDLQRQDLTYQAALQVGARVIQTSLQDFLR